MNKVSWFDRVSWFEVAMFIIIMALILAPILLASGCRTPTRREPEQVISDYEDAAPPWVPADYGHPIPLEGAGNVKPEEE